MQISVLFYSVPAFFCCVVEDHRLISHQHEFKSVFIEICLMPHFILQIKLPLKAKQHPLIHEKTKINDVPLRLSAWSPVNRLVVNFESLKGVSSSVRAELEGDRLKSSMDQSLEGGHCRGEPWARHQPPQTALRVPHCMAAHHHSTNSSDAAYDYFGTGHFNFWLIKKVIDRWSDNENNLET